MIKNLVFDFGKVLVDYDFDRLFEKYIPDEKRRRAFSPILLNEEFVSLIDREVRPFEVLLEEAIEKNRDFEPEIRIFDKHYTEAVTNEMEGMRALLSELKKEGFKLYGLTNWCKRVYETMAQFEIFSLLDGYVISSEEKLIKPETAIYLRLFEKFSIKPEESIFTDDKIANIDGAERAGMKGILFKDAIQFERELRQIICQECNN